MSSKCELKNKLRQTLPKQIEELAKVKEEHGNKVMGEVKVSKFWEE